MANKGDGSRPSVFPLDRGSGEPSAPVGLMAPTNGVIARVAKGKTLAAPEEGARIGQTFVRGNGSQHHDHGGQLAMPFWVIAVLSVVGVLAIVWGMYLLARRRL
jgi:hypothetical protein